MFNESLRTLFFGLKNYVTFLRFRYLLMISRIMSVLTTVRDQLKTQSTPQSQHSYPRFFKEAIKFYGVPTPSVQKIAKTLRQEIKNFDKKTIFWLCEELFASDYCEEAFVACDRSYRMKTKFQEEDFVVFAWWIENYINNRAKCDTFCNHTVGAFVQHYPQYISKKGCSSKFDHPCKKRNVSGWYIRNRW